MLLPDIDVHALVLGWRSVAGRRELQYPGGDEAGFWADLKALQAAERSEPAWVVVPLLLEGQYPAAIPAASLMGAYGKTPAEIEECHASVLVPAPSDGRAGGVAASAAAGTAEQTAAVARGSSWRAERLDSYRADRPAGSGPALPLGRRWPMRRRSATVSAGPGSYAGAGAGRPAWRRGRGVLGWRRQGRRRPGWTRRTGKRSADWVHRARWYRRPRVLLGVGVR